MADKKDKDKLATVTNLPPRAMERSTLQWIPEAAEAVAKLQQRTGLNKTDVANRAVQIYEFIDSEIRAGNMIIVRTPDGHEQVVKIF